MLMQPNPTQLVDAAAQLMSMTQFQGVIREMTMKERGGEMRTELGNLRRTDRSSRPDLE